MAPPIITRIDAAVGTITLNRPEAYNAITVELARGLRKALDELADRANVIVVRGAGGNFSAGGDFKELERLRAEGEPAMRELFEGFHEACGRIASVPVPVIAAVEGYAMAGGFELMQACDFAVVRSDARIGDNQSNFGQVPRRQLPAPTQTHRATACSWADPHGRADKRGRGRELGARVPRLLSRDVRPGRRGAGALTRREATRGAGSNQAPGVRRTSGGS
jgi:hypothetical protein